MNDATKPDGVLLTLEEAQRYYGAIADVLSWFRGFKAARPEGDASLPPQWERLELLNIKLVERAGWEARPGRRGEIR